MTAPAAEPRAHGPAPKYVNQESRTLLATCFAGLVPAAVIAEALREKALREGRIKAKPKTGRRP